MSHAKTSTAAVVRVYDECWLELPNSYLPYSVLVAKDHSAVKPGIIPKLHLSSVLVAGVLPKYNTQETGISGMVAVECERLALTSMGTDQVTEYPRCPQKECEKIDHLVCQI